MTGKPRVHELAKELGLPSKAILAQLSELGEFVKSASSRVEAPVARRLRESLGSRGELAASQPLSETAPAARDPGLHVVDDLSRWSHAAALISACGRANREKRPLTVDLSGVQFAYPNAAVPVAAVLQHFKSMGLGISIVGETDRVRNARISMPLEATPENLEQHRIVNTVWTYFDVEQATALTNRVVEHFESTVTLERGVQEALNICLFEVIDNVFEHSEQNTGYFMAILQGAGTRLALAVGDTGIGALNSFVGSSHHPTNDFDALTLAVQAGVTSTGDRRGNGLYALQKAVENNEGRLQLRSGTGELNIAGTRVWGGDRASMPMISPGDRGFFVDWQIDLKHSVNMVEVLGRSPANLRLESFEDGNDEHVILVRDHEAGLGTRRAAGQLRVQLINRLNLGASHLVLDFEGVAVVGVSFADEVIGKLVQEYGAVQFMSRFRMRNMTPTIESMINRAIGERISTEPPPAITRGTSSQ